MSKPAVVYCIRNKINGHVYVGSTNNPRLRWNQHKCQLRNNKGRSTYLQRAWNLYGESAFEFEIIEEVEDEFTVESAEQKWIDHFMGTVGLYNMGNAGNTPMRGKKLSEESCKNMSLANIGKKLSPERVARMSIERKGKGKTEEWKKKISDSQPGIKDYPELVNIKTGEVIPAGTGLSRMCKEHNLVRGCIRKLIRGDKIDYNGWRVRGNEEIMASWGKSVPPLINKNTGRVVRTEKNAMEFCKDEGIKDYQNLYLVIHGKRKSCMGWMLLNETDQEIVKL